MNQSTISGTVWCLMAAIFLGCFLVQVQPRDDSWMERRTNLHQDETEVRKEQRVEDLYDRYLADLVQVNRRSVTNDSAPKITINTLSTSGAAAVMENAEPEAFVALVSVYDSDSDDDGRFECQIDDDNFRLIELHGTEYKIVTDKVLDHEMQATYKLNIMCQDGGEEPQTSTKEVVVNILDSNDNSPLITVNTLPTNVDGALKVRENTEPGTLVAYVSVSDADSGDNGKFSCILQSSYFKLVKLDVTEFKIVTAKVFDRERGGEDHRITIVCQDSGELPEETRKRMTVIIEDVNDNTPVFIRMPEGGFILHLAENTAVGYYVHRMWATDTDTGDNGDIRFTLDQAADGYFTVDPVSGRITTAAVLKHKETPEVTFNVIASDKGTPPKMSHTRMKIIIDEVKGSSVVVFDEPTYHFAIMENATRGTTVGRVQVANQDSVPDGELVYSFGHRTEYRFGFLFNMNGDTGEIRVISPVDFEKYNMVVLSVVAKKPGSPSAEAEVKVEIMDINDNAPAITISTLSTSGEAEVRQDAEPGSFVAYVSVYDADSGDNGKSTCLLDDDHFRLVEIYGTEFKIVTTAVIEHDYMLTIKCEDNGERPLTTSKQLAVTRQ